MQSLNGKWMKKAHVILMKMKSKFKAALTAFLSTQAAKTSCEHYTDKS